MQGSKKKLRDRAMFLDFIHIFVGILIVVCAVLAFINPEKNCLMFPVIFGLAALLNAVNGIDRIVGSGKDGKRKAAGFALCGAALVLIVLCVLSMISIWR